MLTPDFIRSPLFDTHDMHALFTTRQGGVSPPPGDSFNFAPSDFNPAPYVENNLQRLIDAVPLPCAPKRLQQIHGCRVIRCKHNTENGQRADALFTSEENLPLAVQTADCLPILLADPAHGLLAAVHAGWRGTAAGIVSQTVNAMCKAGASTANMLATLGPCIGPCCFTIDEVCAAELGKRSVHQPYIIRHDYHWSADIAAMNRAQLLQQGLTAKQIESLSLCTSCHPDRFFSYRRDHGNTGRHLAVVVRPSCT